MARFLIRIMYKGTSKVSRVGSYCKESGRIPYHTVWGSFPRNFLKVGPLYMHFPGIWSIISVDLKALEKGDFVLNVYSIIVDIYDFPPTCFPDRLSTQLLKPLWRRPKRTIVCKANIPVTLPMKCLIFKPQINCFCFL